MMLGGAAMFGDSAGGLNGVMMPNVNAMAVCNGLIRGMKMWFGGYYSPYVRRKKYTETTMLYVVSSSLYVWDWTNARNGNVHSCRPII